ncbi:alpha/beta hydrolase [Sphingomonas sinipercae]|uniref:Alpha/beta hydrolase n=1 Tax=Sphingomonas sinipercae TaxID=2714944 RepID=A0A6G7ZNV1_9SPHN|nr:alpha/beta hydrolase [Sphingomonas sinipercae]QIL02613.1 alpha/beta hydrolase [Sphingomonas sinipercae]
MLVWLLSVLSSAPAATPGLAKSVDIPCEAGAYGSPDGRTLALTQSGSSFEYTHLDGRIGVLSHPKTRVHCAAGGVNVTLPNDTVEFWPRIPLRLTRTTFVSDGARLAGLLVERTDASTSTPLVVSVQGSGDEPYTSALWHMQFTLSAQGVSTFVYDKRGTGESEGLFTMNFQQLARDASAAAVEAKRLTHGRHGRFGFYGFSQAGWVIPLAAKQVPTDFIAIGYGMAYTPIEEDAEEVALELRAKGFDDSAIAVARRLTAATAVVIGSGYRRGIDTLATLKRQYSGEPWYKHIRGEFSGRILRATPAELRGRAKSPNDLGLPWHHDAMAVLRTLTVPQLWALAEQDRVTPSLLTRDRLKKLQSEGLPIDIAMFPNTDHGIREFIQHPDGSRTHTRYADGYFRLLVDWIKGSVSPPYGKATYLPRPKN